MEGEHQGALVVAARDKDEDILPRSACVGISPRRTATKIKELEAKSEKIKNGNELLAVTSNDRKGPLNNKGKSWIEKS